MFETFRNAWKIEDLRKRLLFTLAIVVIFRLGCAIPVPFIKAGALTGMFETGTMLTYLNMMSGGALSQCALFALGVTPYINATIIIQLLCVAIPYLENLSREGEEGRRKISIISKMTGAVIALIMSIGYYFVLRRSGMLKYTEGASQWLAALVVIACFVAGAQLVVWLGEQIDTKGIGNGLSLLIFAGIVSRWNGVYNSVVGILARAQNGEPQYYFILPLIAVLAIVAVVFVVVTTNAERRISVQYAKKVVGRKMYGGQNSYIPIKVNMTGVMPIIFASALCSIPGTIGAFVNVDPQVHPIWYSFLHSFNYTSAVYIVLYLLLIVAFNYFYNPIEIANNLRKNNGTIPGIRPGKPTSDFITRVLNKVTILGAAFLAVVAALPIVLGNVTGVSIQLGGTSLLIVVGVALETGRSLESYMLMRHHKGFLE